MVLTSSIKIYEKACMEARRLVQSHNGMQVNVDLEPHYFRTINAMFYELVIKRGSPLLSMLASLNGINCEPINFKLDFKKYNFNQRSSFDILPLLEGLNTAFTKGIDECAELFAKYRNNVFRVLPFNNNYDYFTWITDSLDSLDENLGKLLASGSVEKLEPQKQVVIAQRTHDPKLTEKLNIIAQKRAVEDAALSEKAQKLQVLLQDELRQINLIREGIDYNHSKEAISQFISLYSLISETLIYHPNDSENESYQNLIDSCEDFLEIIKQSLSMLGVEIINDIGKPFDPEKHKAIRGMQPMRMAEITRVAKIGFAYKNIVLEKAEVEL